MKAEFMAKRLSKLARRWTIKETGFFTEISADTDNGFPPSLECFAPKKSTNNVVFRLIQCEFLKCLKSDSFRDINELSISDKYSDPINHKDLDASTDRLQIK